MSAPKLAAGVRNIHNNLSIDSGIMAGESNEARKTTSLPQVEKIDIINVDNLPILDNHKICSTQICAVEKVVVHRHEDEKPKYSMPWYHQGLAGCRRMAHSNPPWTFACALPNGTKTVSDGQRKAETDDVTNETPSRTTKES